MRDNMPRPRSTSDLRQDIRNTESKLRMVETRLELWTFLPWIVASNTLGCSIAIGVMHLIGVL